MALSRDGVFAANKFSRSSASYTMGFEAGTTGAEFRCPNESNPYAALDYRAGYDEGCNARRAEQVSA